MTQTVEQIEQVCEGYCRPVEGDSASASFEVGVAVVTAAAVSEQTLHERRLGMDVSQARAREMADRALAIRDLVRDVRDESERQMLRALARVLVPEWF